MNDKSGHLLLADWSIGNVLAWSVAALREDVSSCASLCIATSFGLFPVVGLARYIKCSLALPIVQCVEMLMVDCSSAQLTVQ